MRAPTALAGGARGLRRPPEASAAWSEPAASVSSARLRPLSASPKARPWPGTPVLRQEDALEAVVVGSDMEPPAALASSGVTEDELPSPRLRPRPSATGDLGDQEEAPR